MAEFYAVMEAELRPLLGRAAAGGDLPGPPVAAAARVRPRSPMARPSTGRRCPVGGARACALTWRRSWPAGAAIRTPDEEKTLWTVG